MVVDATSGKLPTTQSPSTKEEIFAEYNQPSEFDDVHISLPYDSLTNAPASPTTPPDRIIYKAFTVFHSEQPQNSDWERAVYEWFLKNGFAYPEGQGPLGGQASAGEISAKLIQPKDGSVVENSGFQAVVEASGTNPIARVDLFIDGQFYKSLASAPYRYEINKALSNGQHSIAARATDTEGKTGDTSILINYGSLDSLALIDPASDTLAVFPITLSAESGRKYDQINFYYEADAELNLVGSLDSASNVGGRYRYSLVWDKPPLEKEFKVFARTPNGVETKKIKISVP